jgi:UDP:flavonoid glycosyltransferase YjiC (YdhE family)
MRALLTCRPLTGHYRPMLPLARALTAAGHNVAFASGDPIAREAAADGFTSFRAGLGVDARELLRRKFPEVDSLPPAQIRPFVFRELFVNIELGPRAGDLMEIAEAWKPDVIVHEVAEFAGPLVATAFGIPYADHSFGPAVALDVIRGAGAAAAPDWRAHGLEPDALGGFYRHLYIDICPARLQIADAVPGDVQELRAFESAPSGEPEPDWLDALRDLPTVYVTLGTMYNQNLDVFRTVLEGLRGEELNVVVTVGNQNDPAAMGPQPANVQIHRFVPQDLLLPECTLAVIHGGAGSTMGALAFGLPLLLIPQGADQFFNTERVVAAGAGIGLLPGRFSADSVRQAVRALLDDEGYRGAAQGIAREIAAMPDAADTVVALERLVTRA